MISDWTNLGKELSSFPQKDIFENVRGSKLLPNLLLILRGLLQAEPSAQGEEETYVVRFLDLASGRKSEIFRKTGPFSHIWFAVSPGEEWILYVEAPRGPSDLMLVENFR